MSTYIFTAHGPGFKAVEAASSTGKHWGEELEIGHAAFEGDFFEGTGRGRELRTITAASVRVACEVELQWTRSVSVEDASNLLMFTMRSLGHEETSFMRLYCPKSVRAELVLACVNSSRSLRVQSASTRSEPRWSS